MKSNVLKTFNENDFKFAEQIAKLSINEEKKIEVLNEKDKPKAISFEVKFDKDHLLESKNNEKINAFENSISNKKKCTFGCKQRRNREGNMRIKQTTRIAYDISKLIESLEKKSKRKYSSEFVAPLELEKKEKHWQDFCHSARRSLYSLKREVSELSVKITAPLFKQPGNLLRSLSSSTRSCFQLLKGLENFESEIRFGEKGNVLLQEALLIAQQLLFIITMNGGVTEFHNYPPPYLKEDSDTSFEATEDTLTRSMDIMSSDLDNSRIAALLKPNAVRKKLTSLTRKLRAKHGQKKYSHLKYLSPLQQELNSSNYSERRLYPMIEDLDGGRKIEFVNDNLSPKLRKRLPNQRKRKYFHSEDRLPLKNDFANEENQVENKLHTNVSSYGVSEEMADAVFERILPYISTTNKELSNDKIENSNLEIYVYLEAQKKLIEMQERIDKLERVTETQKELLSSSNAILLEQPSNLSDALNIDVTIQKANTCLEKYIKHSFPYHESSAKVVLDNLLLSNTPDEQNGFFTQDPNFPSMQHDIKNLKLEFWNSLNGKINTKGASFGQSKVTLPLHTSSGLQIKIPHKDENGEPINIDGQEVFECNIDSEKGMKNINIKTDSFAEKIKIVSDSNTTLRHNNGSIEDSSINSHVSHVLEKKLLLDSSGNFKMIQKENIDYTERNVNSISKDSSNSKENSISEDVGTENFKHLKYSEDLENDHPHSEQEVNGKLFSKVGSEKNVISQDISENLIFFEEKSIDKSECTEDSDRTSHKSFMSSGT